MSNTLSTTAVSHRREIDQSEGLYGAVLPQISGITDWNPDNPARLAMAACTRTSIHVAGPLLW